MQKMVGEYQIYFIKGHSVLGDIIAIHEIVHERKHGFLFKLDFSEVNDMVNLDCLL